MQYKVTLKSIPRKCTFTLADFGVSVPKQPSKWPDQAPVMRARDIAPVFQETEAKKTLTYWAYDTFGTLAPAPLWLMRSLLDKVSGTRRITEASPQAQARLWNHVMHMLGYTEDA
jgi:hypothetical protein